MCRRLAGIVAADNVEDSEYNVVTLKPRVFHKIRISGYMGLANDLDALPTVEKFGSGRRGDFERNLRGHDDYSIFRE
jgi:hypothetical protein